MNPPSEYAACKLKATFVTKYGLLANANWVHRQAIIAHTIRGDNHARPTTRQIEIMLDVLASFAWKCDVLPPCERGKINDLEGHTVYSRGAEQDT